jgi:undecaprenyl-diphosphatase
MFGRRQCFQPVIVRIRPLLDWIGKYELDVLLALLFLVVSLWGFIAIADAVVAGRTMKFDEWVVRALRKPNQPAIPIGPHWMTEVARDVTALGGLTFLTLLTATIAGFLWLRRMFGAMLVLLVATLGGLAVNSILKLSFDRPRPEVVPHLALVYTSSFPSGHAMLSATVFLTLGTLLGQFIGERVLKAYFLIVAVVLTVLVGASRVYLGVHYPTDVLTGWAAGLAWAILCWLIARTLQRRQIVESGAAS